MNRRNFMKAVGGVLAGVMLVPKAKPQLTVAMVTKARDELVLNEMERLRLEAAFKAANPPLVFNPNEEDEVIFQKYCKGDRVRIADELPIWMSHFPGTGKKATIDYSYDDKFRVKDPPSKRPQYALEIDGLRWSAWYPEYLLKKI